MNRFKAIMALAAAAVVFATAGAAVARTTQVITAPKLSTQIVTPKIAVPKICKNEISRTLTVNGIRYTAKKCG